MNSILQQEKECLVCGTTSMLERHHVFGGAYRKKSERDGLTVYLCHYHHNEPPEGVHHNRQNMDKLRQWAEKLWLIHYDKTIDDFIKEYGRNYLTGQEFFND